MPRNLQIGDSKVLESRETPDGTMIRRRRITSDGKYRFTTYERIEMPELTVLKGAGIKRFSTEASSLQQYGGAWGSISIRKWKWSR